MVHNTNGYSTVKLENVTFSYNKKSGNAVEGVSFEARPGQILGLLGHNGAGKTTTLRLIAGLLQPQHGNIRACHLAPSNAAAPRNLTAMLPEGTGVYAKLTGSQNLEFRARAAGIPRAQIRPLVTEWLARLGLSERSQQEAGYWSKGLRQRLALACALIARPRVLLLDEPTVGLDPESLEVVIAILLQERDAGTTIIMSSHDLPSIAKMCERIVILQHARLIYNGSTPKNADELKRMYLEHVLRMEK